MRLRGPELKLWLGVSLLFTTHNSPSLSPSLSSQPAPPQIDMNRLGGVLKTIHHSIRMRNRHNPNAMATLTDNALKEVFNHVSLTPPPSIELIEH